MHGYVPMQSLLDRRQGSSRNARVCSVEMRRAISVRTRRTSAPILERAVLGEAQFTSVMTTVITTLGAVHVQACRPPWRYRGQESYSLASLYPHWFARPQPRTLNIVAMRCIMLSLSLSLSQVSKVSSFAVVLQSPHAEQLRSVATRCLPGQ